VSVAESALRRVLASYPDDPTGYALDVLGAHLTHDQLALPNLLLAPPHRLLVPSGNKLGKSFAAGWLVNWHYDSFAPGITLVTSATATSLKTQVFKEVRKLRPMGRDLLPRAPSIYGAPDHQVIGYSPKNPDAAQGHHAAHWLLVMDEATAVPIEIAERAETMFSGIPGHAWLCLYNPNDPTTWPYAAEQSGAWAVHRLSALAHPNLAAELRGEPPPFSGAVRLARIEQRIVSECEDCGATPHDETCFEWPPRESFARARLAPFDRARWWKPVKPEFDPQVRGRWPSQSMYGIWSDSDERRCNLAPEVDPQWPVQIGCDVARMGGDRTTFAVRRGTALVHLEERTSWPTRRVTAHICGRLRELCHQYAPAWQGPRGVPCAVDDTGGYGAGVTDHPDGYNFIGVGASCSAADPTRYPNKRSELWFVTRLAADQDAFFTGTAREGAHLLPALWQELRATRYSLDARNRRVAEGKDRTRERLRRSPDLADAVNLAWYPMPRD
jgi:hypothetical protein